MNLQQALSEIDDQRKYTREVADNLDTVRTILWWVLPDVWKECGLTDSKTNVIPSLNIVEFNADDMKGWLTVQDDQLAELPTKEYEGLCSIISSKFKDLHTSAQAHLMFRHDGEDTFTIGVSIYTEITTI